MKKLFAILSTVCLFLAGTCCKADEMLEFEVDLFYHNNVTYSGGGDSFAGAFTVRAKKGDELIFLPVWNDEISDWMVELQGGKIVKTGANGMRIGNTYCDMEGCVWKYEVKDVEKGQSALVKLFSQNNPKAIKFQTHIVCVDEEGRLIQRFYAHYAQYGYHELVPNGERNFTLVKEPAKVYVTKDGPDILNLWLDVILTEDGKKQYEQYVDRLPEGEYFVIPYDFFEKKENKILKVYVDRIEQFGIGELLWVDVDLSLFQTDVVMWTALDGQVHLEEYDEENDFFWGE